MRIAVVSTPRTCSSLVGSIFANKYSLRNLSEIVSTCKDDDCINTLLDYLVTRDNFVVKITSTSFLRNVNTLKYTTFPWNIFDKIILTERVKLEDQYASWILLNDAQVNGHFSDDNINKYINELLKSDITTFPVNNHVINHISKDIDFYYDVLKPYLLGGGLPTHILTHELFQDEVENYLGVLNESLNEDIDTKHITMKTKSSIDYSKFVKETNLIERIKNAKKFI